MTELLLGVRRPTPASQRHPGVLSTPTMRLPRPVFDDVAGRYAEALAGRVGVIRSVPGDRAVRIGSGSSLAHVETFIIESLLARKLDLADALVLGRIQGVATAVTIAVDDVDDPLGTGQSERTHMISYQLVLGEGADVIPAESSSYSRLIWAPAHLLARAVATRDALLLDDSLDPIEVCIHGLCVRSAAYQLDQAGGLLPGDAPLTQVDAAAE
jgi:hypothetical protein